MLFAQRQLNPAQAAFILHGAFSVDKLHKRRIGAPVNACVQGGAEFSLDGLIKPFRLSVDSDSPVCAAGDGTLARDAVKVSDLIQNNIH